MGEQWPIDEGLRQSPAVANPRGRISRSITVIAALAAPLLSISLLSPGAANAAPVPTKPPTTAPTGPVADGKPGTQQSPSSAAAMTKPDEMLRTGWRNSHDRAVTTVGDETGL